MDAHDIRSVPSWSELLRIFPISMWVVGLIFLGWWARGAADVEFIEYLKLTCEAK